MSHELRTPLNVVVGYTGMIMDGLLGEVNDKQKEALEKVIRRTNDQLVLVNNILYATIIETEKIKVESHPVVLGDFFKQLSSTYETPLNKQLSFNWDCPTPLAVIHTDSAKLKQILQNLIDNALKFTGKGSVTVSARVIKEAISDQPSAISHQQSAIRNSESAISQVEFKVADTGAGIPQDYMPFIFDKFRQADSSETRLYGGVGMGLYIVKKFAELLGGTVEVESEVGKGSTFTARILCGSQK
jgi:signal transduction histidine kinase